MPGPFVWRCDRCGEECPAKPVPGWWNLDFKPRGSWYGMDELPDAMARRAYCRVCTPMVVGLLDAITKPVPHTELVALLRSLGRSSVG